MKRIQQKDQYTTKWSGGLTTELYIYPENSDYNERNFKYRLSTATVEIERSVFTSLPGVDRTLMVLEGEMKLIHKDQHSKVLRSLDKDNFKGDWITESIGMCADLNLMCREGAQGQVDGYLLSAGAEKELTFKGISNFMYLYKGALEVNGLSMTDGDFVILDNADRNLVIKALEPCELVCISITDL